MASSLPFSPHQMPVSAVRKDALPEGRLYLDTGCYVAPACLACPLPECVLINPARRTTVKARSRRLRVHDLHDANTPINEIAALVGISRRSVFRALSSTAPLTE